MKYKFLFKTFLIWRFVCFIPLILGCLFFPYRSGYEFANIFNLSDLKVTRAIYSLANFDGVRYLAIAQRGYITEGAFFPLYPLLVKFVSIWSSDIPTLFWVGLLFSIACLVAGMIFLNKLLCLDYPKKVSQEIVLLMLVFPTAFFFGAVYSESLFLLLSVLSFYLARKNMWFWAYLTAFFLSTTRLVGIFILPALLYEYYIYEYYLQKGVKMEWKKLLGFLFIPLGFISYMVFCFQKWGDALYFVHAHGQLANSRSVDRIILFPQTIYRYYKILFTLPTSQYEWWIALLELSVFVFALTFLYVAWRKKVRLSYLIFSALAFFLPVSSGTFSGLPRYVLVLFPIFIALALSKSKLLKIGYILIGAVLQFVLLMFFSRGYFVS